MKLIILLLSFSLILSETEEEEEEINLTYSTFPFTEKTLSLNINCNQGIYDNGYLKKIIISKEVLFTTDILNISNGACFFIPDMNNSLYTTTLNFPSLNETIITFFIKPNEFDTEEERYETRPIISLVKEDNYFDLITISKNSHLIINAFKKIELTEEEEFEYEEEFLKGNNDYILEYEFLNDISTWSFIVISFINKTMQLYFNGENLNISKSYLNFVNISSYLELYIGGNPITGKYYSGSLDEINFYHMKNYFKNATDERINNLYNNSLCKKGQYYNTTTSICIDCSIKNCIHCYSENYCIECSSGFLFNKSDNECECQKDNCNECNNKGECTSCFDGYHINERKNCEKNDCSNIDQCLNCYNENICYECSGKYELKNGKCKPFQKAIISVFVCYVAAVIVVWIIVIVVLRPRLMK